MAGPAIVVVAGLVTFRIAYQHKEDLVVEDYYKEGLAINQSIELDAHATALGVAANVMLGSGNKDIRILLDAPEGMQRPSELDFRLIHPIRKDEDEEIRLKVSGGNFYAGTLNRPISGRWNVIMGDPNGQWRLTGRWNVNETPVLRLVPIAGSSSLSNVAGR